MFQRMNSHSIKRSERKAKEAAERQRALRKQHEREEVRRMKEYLHGMDRDQLKAQLRDDFFPGVHKWMDSLSASVSSAVRFGQFRKSRDESFNRQVKETARRHRDASRNFELCLSGQESWHLKIKTNLAPNGRVYPIIEFAGKIEGVKYLTLRDFLGCEDCKQRCKRWICGALDPLVQKFDHVLSGGYRLLMTLKSCDGSSCAASLQPGWVPFGDHVPTAHQCMRMATPYRCQDDRRRCDHYFPNVDEKMKATAEECVPLAEMERLFHEGATYPTRHYGTGSRLRANAMYSRY